MPALAALAEGAPTAIEVDFDSLDEGARITFTAADPPLVEALHVWAEAQVSDHGPQAEHGSSQR